MRARASFDLPPSRCALRRASRRRPDAAPLLPRGARSGRNSAGFTLLEILIALIILIVSLVSIFALFGAATSSHRRAVAAQNAAQLAWTVLSELEQLPRPAMMPSITGQTHPAFEGYTYDVLVNPCGFNEVQVEVVVHWKRAGKDETETYRTILLNR